MAAYLVDTNHLSPLVTPSHPLRLKLMEALMTGDSFAVSVPTLTELLFGISLLPRANQNLAEWERLESSFTFYDIERTDANLAAQLQITLRRRGWQLETVDALIAAVALRYDLTLLTTDKDFRGIVELKQENWLIK